MDEIFSYIAQDNIVAAESILRKLDESIAQLGEFPNMGSVISDEEYKIIKTGYRFIVIDPYLVFYRIIDGTNGTVIMHRILHGRRDYLRELFKTQLL